MLIKFFASLFCVLLWFENGYADSTRGIDFRLQFFSGALNFTSISGVKRDFRGIGSELQASLYLFEHDKLRMNIFLAPRIMSWEGLGVAESDYDDLQGFTLSSGLEFHYGPFFLQGAYGRTSAMAYFIADASKAKRFTFDSPSLAGGFNWRFANLGIGAGYTLRKAQIEKDSLDLTEASQYVETCYSLNFIYYMSTPPGRFFKKLFRSQN